MKRYIAIFLIAMITVMTVNVWAESPDLGAYDDSALLELLEQVQQEVTDRHIEKTAEMQAGTYIGGRDIPGGTYIYTCMATGEEWGNVTIYTLDDEGGHDKQCFWEVMSAPEEGEEQKSFVITVNEGEELSSQVPFSLTIYAGPSFK